MPFSNWLSFTVLPDEPTAEVLASPRTLAFRYSDVRNCFKAGLATAFAGGDTTVIINRNDVPPSFAAIERLMISSFVVRLSVVFEVPAMVSGSKSVRGRDNVGVRMGDSGTRSRSRLRSKSARALSASERLPSREGGGKARGRKAFTGADGEGKKVAAMDHVVREKEVESEAANGFVGAASYFFITDWGDRAEGVRTPRGPAPEGFVDSSEEGMDEFSPSMGDFIVDDADVEKLAEEDRSAKVPVKKEGKPRRASLVSERK